jgi:hypothetical protein
MSMVARPLVFKALGAASRSKVPLQTSFFYQQHKRTFSIATFKMAEETAKAPVAAPVAAPSESKLTLHWYVALN